MKRFIFLILFLLSFLNINAQLTNDYYGTGYNFWYVGYAGFPVIPMDTTYIDSIYEYNGLPMAWDSNGVGYGGTTFGKLRPTKVLRLNEVSSPTFISGWAGSGFRLDQGVADTGVSTIEVDNAFIRGSMTVNELIRNQIRGENGNLYISSVGKIDSVSNDSIWFEDPDNNDLCAFYTNDLIRVQRWDPLGNSIHVGAGKVVSVTGRMIKVLIYNGTFNENDVVVRFGNTTNTARQGSIYIASIGSNTPYMDIVDGVDTVLAWGGYLKTKARFGDLGGVVSAKYGALYGYGLWARDNIWLENGFIALSDSGHIRAGKTSYTDNTAGFYLGNDSGTPRFFIGNATDYLKWDGANLTMTGSITIQNPSDINTSDLTNDEGWTAGADWSSNLTNIPSTLQTPTGAGLFLGSTNMGYYDGATWKTYMDNTGNFYLGGTSGSLTWSAGTNALTISNGTINSTDINSSTFNTGSGFPYEVSVTSSGIVFLELSSGITNTIAQNGTGITFSSSNAAYDFNFSRNVDITGDLSVSGSYGLSSGDIPNLPASIITSGTFDAARIPDLSGTYALSSHNHAASNITSGTFDIARIPTGTTSTTVALGNHLHTGVYAATSHAHSTSDITSGTLSLGRGGTGNTTFSALKFVIADAFGSTLESSSYGASDFSQVGHTHTFASLTSKPTTISGYGITDASWGATTSFTITIGTDDVKFNQRALNIGGTSVNIVYGAEIVP